MLTKSLAYKIYWTGRYLERIEDICRASIMALQKGESLDDVAKAFGLSKGEDVFEYIKRSYVALRENIRGFGDESLLVEVNTLEFKINLPKDALLSYFYEVENGIIQLGSRIESYFIEESKKELKVRSQEENEPEV